MVPDTDTYHIPVGWEGWPSVVCLGPKVLQRTISRESPRSLCWSWGLKFHLSMKTRHLTRSSHIKLAGKSKREKSQEE